MKGRVYIKNALLLTVTGLVLRLLGMLFRVVIAGQIGNEGMGLYQLVLSVYMVFVSLASAGVNVASTRLAAQTLARGQSFVRCRRSLVTAGVTFGTVAMLAQYLAAEWLAAYGLHDIRAELGLRVLAPSLPFIAAAGALRGCFMAQRNVVPNVVSQLIEQLVRFAAALLALQKLGTWGPGYACAAVLIGNTVSEAVSCLLMLLFAKNGKTKAVTKAINPLPPFTGRELMEIVLPVGANRILGSLLQAVESSLLPLCLTAYLGQRSMAVAQYGALKGMALPLVFFPFSVLAALSGLLMPEITRTHTQNDTKATAHLIRTAMLLTGVFSVLACVGLFLFGRPLALLLYHDEQVGQYVRLLGLVAPFMYLESMVDGILKGMGEQLATFRYSVITSGLRIAGIIALVPKYGLWAFLGIMAVSNLLSCALNTARMLHMMKTTSTQKQRKSRAHSL